MKRQIFNKKDKGGFSKTKMKRILAAACILCALFGMERFGISAQAAQNTQTVQNGQDAGAGQERTETSFQNQIMVAETDVDMKAEPAADAETLMTYEKGALLFVTGETADGWYFVTYQDKKGYVEKESLSIKEMDVEGLDAEMSVSVQEGRLVMETVEKYRAEARRSKIWGGIIITLVAAIFAFGIFSAVRTKKSEASGRIHKRNLEIEDWNV